jgi:hypothetical protein
MSTSQAEQWANGAAADRVTRAILHHAVWIAVQDVPIGWVEVDEDEWQRFMSHLIAPARASALASSCTLKRRSGMAATRRRLEASPNAANFYLHRGYLPGEARTADGALPLTKCLSQHGSNSPPRPTGSAGG